MSRFLYYLPEGHRGMQLDEIRAAGLAHAFEAPPTPSEVRGGPDDGVGVILASKAPESTSRVGYYPDKQTWRKIPGCKCWVGMYTDERPGPKDLERAGMLEGHLVEMGDGADWLCPVARAAAEQEDGTLAGCQVLPAKNTLDEHGNWIRGGVVAKYAELWDIAIKWWDQFIGANRKDDATGDGKTLTLEFDFAKTRDAAVVALATNYRVGPAEVALLDLFNDQCVLGILGALVDWPTWVEYTEKKTTVTDPPSPAGTSSIGDGPADGTGDTGQP